MSNFNKTIVQQRLSEIKKLDNISVAISQIKELLQDFPRFLLGWIELGIAYRQIGDRYAALDTFRQAAKIAPDHQKIRLELAKEQLHIKCFSESRKNFQHVLQLNPQNFFAIYQLGQICRLENSREEALSFFQQALKLQPEKIDVIINIADELCELNKFEEAKKYLKQALKYDSSHFRVLIKLGELEEVRQNLNQAIAYFKKAQENHPSKVKPGIKIVTILRSLNHVEAADKQLDWLLQKFPDNYNVLTQFGFSFDQKGQKKQALEWFSQAVQVASSPVDVMKAKLQFIRVLRDLGCLDKALLSVDEIISKYPSDIRAQMMKGSILQQKPNLLAAANVYKSILSHDSNHLDSRIELAKVYSHLGQIEKAIAFLEETKRLLGESYSLLIQLGVLNQAVENWRMASYCYKRACQKYPENHDGYCRLASLYFAQGKVEAALTLLQTASNKLPNAVQIIIKICEINRYLGNSNLGHELLVKNLRQFPNHMLLLLQLCHFYLNRGDFSDAINTLDRISIDSQKWIAKTHKLRARAYFDQYDYAKAEEYFRKAISLAPVATAERNSLAIILTLVGKIDEARQELVIATQELSLKTPHGKSIIPLKSHSAMLINEIRINPFMMEKLLATEQKAGQEKILALGNLLKEEPTYFGTALYLARELGIQGIFKQVQQALSNHPQNTPPIPKRIVQFWDQSEPPSEVLRICQSWIDFNPEYEYIRFSFETAVAFLKENYDRRVIDAFANCEQPATQADFFRLAYLNKMGGFYADADDMCRQSLDDITSSNPELIIIREDFACIGNNFIGCIPNQKAINAAFDQAVINTQHYCNESPWLKTGPGLFTSAVCNSLLPYLSITNYQMWPKILVLDQIELRKIISQHIQLPYKKTDKSWKQSAYHSRVKTISKVA